MLKCLTFLYLSKL